MSYLCNQLEASFEEHLSTHPTLAVAVSGGADSVFCALAVHEWTRKKNKTVTSITIDHGIRPEARDEAVFVSSLMNQHNIAHQTLTWSPQTASPSQDDARHARYELLRSFCEKSRIPVLITGHHALDQAETILMRIARQSHLRGLRGMGVTQQLTPALTLVRPLLDLWPDEIKHRLQQKNIKWIEDPSNKNDKYLRTHLRHALTTKDSELAKIGMTPEGLINWSRKITQTDDYIAHCVEEFLAASHNNSAGIIAHDEFLDLHEELQRHVLEYLIRQHAPTLTYPPRWESILNLQKHLKAKRTATLSGLKFQVKQNQICISPENSAT